MYYMNPLPTDVMNKVQANKKEDTKLMVTLLSEARGADRLAGQCDLLEQSIQNWWASNFHFGHPNNTVHSVRLPHLCRVCCVPNSCLTLPLIDGQNEGV